MLDFHVMMMQPPPGELVYSWEDPDTDKVRMWATGRMEKWLPTSGKEVQFAACEASRARWYIDNRGIEAHRVEWLLNNQEVLKNPSMLMRVATTHAEEGFWDLMLDGHHRYVALAILKTPTFPFYHLTEEEARQFEIRNVPQPRPGAMEHLVKNSFSGIVR